jgi:hypothetical protein
MKIVSYRCLRLPTQPLMDRVRCIARGLKPELFDDCVGCMYAISRKAITSYKEKSTTTYSKEA